MTSMKKALVIATALAACAALPAYAATEAECQAMWTKADVNKDGVLTDAEVDALCRGDARARQEARRRRQGSIRPRSWTRASPMSTCAQER